MALSCARLQSAATEEEWFQLLESVLAGIPNELCVLIDLEILNSTFAPLTKDFPWPAAFQGLFRSLSDRCFKTRVKVLLVSYASPVILPDSQSGFSESVIQVKISPHGPRRRRGGPVAKRRMVPLLSHRIGRPKG